MKIIGITSYHNEPKIVLKSDSSLLVNRKPFFTPDGMRITAQRCVVLRICRLGKDIEPRFAQRYYDAVTMGVNFVCQDALLTHDWATAYAFDYSLAVGTWMGEDQTGLTDISLLMSPAEAIRRISQVMTLRQGDFVFIDTTDPCKDLQRDEILSDTINNECVLYCKIK